MLGHLCTDQGEEKLLAAPGEHEVFQGSWELLKRAAGVPCLQKSGCPCRKTPRKIFEGKGSL